MIDIIAVKGSKRDMFIQKEPKIKLIGAFLRTYILEFWIMVKKRDHWKNVLVRIISIIKFLAKHSIAFRGTKERLYENNNGNFLDLIEMLTEFDLVIQEHVRRITSDDIRFHYLGHNIQNELISLIASSIKSEIIKKVRQAKYFSVILDCTPDVSHQEQMSMMLRFVDISSSSIVIEELFLGFINVNDTTGQGIFDIFLQELKLLDLEVDNVRGQGYDNGSNMKGRNQGVQKKLLDVNPRAFYTPCGSHSLNLMLCVMVNTCSKARDFFGAIQRIYTIFANSTKRSQILKDNVKELTLKSLSYTRWESRVDSVKAVRFQIGEVNVVSKSLQSVDMLIDVAIKKIEAASQSPEDALRVNYFVYIVDQAVVLFIRGEHCSVKTDSPNRYNRTELNRLKSSCDSLAIALRNGDCNDIDANELYVELKLLVQLLPRKYMRAVHILQYLKHMDCFLNAIIAYRILLTTLVTVASAERSFFKLKLLKS
uniref:DUF4371 domain-containing protein n=1 Tax=Kalanchoe fedtschenkoi TaxID=63787 RepID=A0A7N0UUV2_KALFE